MWTRRPNRWTRVAAVLLLSAMTSIVVPAAHAATVTAGTAGTTPGPDAVPPAPRLVGNALTEPGPVLPWLGAGDSSAYSLASTTLQDGRAVTLRWNPCQVISYRINVSALPPAQQPLVAAEIRSAVARLSAATGMVYGYRGLTDAVPRSTSVDLQPAELVVAVTSAVQTDFLEPGMLGYGGYRFWEWSTVAPAGTAADAAIARGWVVVDAEGLQALTPGFGPGMTRGNVFLHELAHTTGLQHIDDPGELLNPTLLEGSPSGFAPGDLAGLTRLGSASGCITVPDGVVPDLP